jgi:cell wall-associated NlpC family hydrolase
VALAALTTVPDYDIDPLLLAGLNQKLAQVQADQRRLAVELRGQQGQLGTLQAQAQRDAAAAAAAKAVADDAQRHYEEVVSQAYMSSDGLSPAVDALLSPVSNNYWEAMYSANLMNTYLRSRTTQMSLALQAMQQAGADATARLAQAEQAERSVRATQREDAAALQTTAAIKLKIQQRVAEIRRELAAKQAAQRVAASGATVSWETYLNDLGAAGVKPPSMAELRDPAHLPKGLRPLVDSSGQAQAGVAVRPSAHGSLLVLPKETIAAIGFAFAQLGKPYVFGATGPSGFDCSGLTMASYASAGVAIPRISWDQYAWVTPVKPGDEMPGDLVFFAGDDGTATHPGHVAMVIDPVRHLMIQAPQTGDVVKVSDYAQWGGLVGFGRVSTAG